MVNKFEKKVNKLLDSWEDKKQLDEQEFKTAKNIKSALEGEPLYYKLKNKLYELSKIIKFQINSLIKNIEDDNDLALGLLDSHLEEKEKLNDLTKSKFERKEVNKISFDDGQKIGDLSKLGYKDLFDGKQLDMGPNKNVILQSVGCSVESRENGSIKLEDDAKSEETFKGTNTGAFENKQVYVNGLDKNGNEICKKVEITGKLQIDKNSNKLNSLQIKDLKFGNIDNKLKDFKSPVSIKFMLSHEDADADCLVFLRIDRAQIQSQYKRDAFDELVDPNRGSGEYENNWNRFVGQVDEILDDPDPNQNSDSQDQFETIKNDYIHNYIEENTNNFSQFEKFQVRDEVNEILNNNIQRDQIDSVSDDLRDCLLDAIVFSGRKKDFKDKKLKAIFENNEEFLELTSEITKDYIIDKIDSQYSNNNSNSLDDLIEKKIKEQKESRIRGAIMNIDNTLLGNTVSNIYDATVVDRVGRVFRENKSKTMIGGWMKFTNLFREDGNEKVKIDDMNYMTFLEGKSNKFEGNYGDNNEKIETNIKVNSYDDVECTLKTDGREKIYEGTVKDICKNIHTSSMSNVKKIYAILNVLQNLSGLLIDEYGTDNRLEFGEHSIIKKGDNIEFQEEGYNMFDIEHIDQSISKISSIYSKITNGFADQYKNNIKATTKHLGGFVKQESIWDKVPFRGEKMEMDFSKSKNPSFEGYLKDGKITIKIKGFEMEAKNLYKILEHRACFGSQIEIIREFNKKLLKKFFERKNVQKYGYITNFGGDYYYIDYNKNRNDKMHFGRVNKGGVGDGEFKDKLEETGPGESFDTGGRFGRIKYDNIQGRERLTKKNKLYDNPNLMMQFSDVIRGKYK